MMFAVAAVYSILLALFAYFVWRLRRSGLFDVVGVTISANPPMLNKTITIYYKHHIGPYNRLSTAFQEAKSLIPEDGALIAIYYDDPNLAFCASDIDDTTARSIRALVKGTRCQALPTNLLAGQTVGDSNRLDIRARKWRDGKMVMSPGFPEEGQDYYTKEYSEKLTKWGYERMVLSKVDRAVVSTQKFIGYISLFTLLNFTYPKVNTYLKKHGLPVRVAVEIYSKEQVHVVIPLDHHEDFVVSQLMTTEEVEKKLAREKSESDIEDESTSDTEVDDEQEPVTDARSDSVAAQTSDDGDKKNE